MREASAIIFLRRPFLGEEIAELGYCSIFRFMDSFSKNGSKHVQRNNYLCAKYAQKGKRIH